MYVGIRKEGGGWGVNARSRETVRGIQRDFILTERISYFKYVTACTCPGPRNQLLQKAKSQSVFGPLTMVAAEVFF